MNKLPVDETAFRKWLHSRLDPLRTLDPDHELYVPLYEGTDQDPIAFIEQDIDYGSDGSLNFLSGFSGTGKSTQLQRLRKNLQAKGFFVAYGNAADYFLPTQPVSIDIFLISLAGAFSDALEADHKLSLAHQSYWQRFIHWLTETNVSLENFDFDAKIPKTELGLKFKFLLRENPSFVQKLQEQMARRPLELREHIKAFFAHGTALVQQKYGAALQPVFIFDSFEQLHDTPQTNGAVADSIATIVTNHQSDLRIPGHHMVITMPPWMKLIAKGQVNIRFLYDHKLWDSSVDRKPNREGIANMRETVRKRFTDEGLSRFFGPVRGNRTHPLVDELIRASGGHLRDLIVLLRETLIRSGKELATKRIVTNAIANHRNSFLPLSLEQAEALNAIALHRRCNLPDNTPNTIHTYTQLFNSHCALILRNGEEWYDVHPILRDTVADLVARYKRQPGAETPSTNA